MVFIDSLYSLYIELDFLIIIMVDRPWEIVFTNACVLCGILGYIITNFLKTTTTMNLIICKDPLYLLGIHLPRCCSLIGSV